MSWEQAEQEAQGLFLTWDDAPFEVRFCGSPKVISKRHWVDNKYVDCTMDADGECKHCSDGLAVKKHFTFDVVHYPAEAEKELRLSMPAFVALLKVRKNLGDRFGHAVLSCAAEGTGKNTVYTYTAVQFVDAPF